MTNEAALGAIQSLAHACGVYVPGAADVAHTDCLHCDGRLIAFASWQVVGDEATLLALAVDGDYRRRGCAQTLLLRSEARLRALGVQRWFLEVREGNAAALGLYQRFGYAVVGRRRDYYPARDGSHDREDALIMGKEENDG